MLAPSSAFALLPALEFVNVNSRQRAELRLYDAQGRVDLTAAGQLDVLLADQRRDANPEHRPLDRRLLQLVYRAAYHFVAPRVDVVSAYRRARRRREGPHATGCAIDFKLPGVAAATLASYLRKLPRVGVGVYTHPKTQYVHLDVRAQSFHWLDASPPGRNWRERELKSTAHSARDAAYVEADDLPESIGSESGR